MMSAQNRWLAIVLALATFGLLGCVGEKAAVTEPLAPPPPTMPESAKSNQMIQVLDARIKANPDDFVAYNKLASEYLRQLRETGDTAYLDLALDAAKTSLTILPAELNKGGLAVLIQAELSSHNFAASRDHAKRLSEIDPGKGYVYQLLGDAHMELGEYEEAKAAYKKMEELGGLQAMTLVAIEQRLSRLAVLEGNGRLAKQRMAAAIRIAERPPGTNPETVALCHWFMGELEFSSGGYEDAERHYNAALKAVPGYFPSLASMALIRSARGDEAGAIALLEEVTAKRPDLEFVALLGDLYARSGRPDDAARQYSLVEQIAQRAAAKGETYDHELTLYYANHDLNREQACEAAAAQYKLRRDIYSADIFAWACLKAGRVDVARTAITDALRFGTQDARLFYHAGMIELAAGNRETARKQLTAALKLNPAFDPAQADVARRALRDLN